MAVHGGLRPEATPAASRATVRFSPEMGIDMIFSKPSDSVVKKKKKKKTNAVEVLWLFKLCLEVKFCEHKSHMKRPGAAFFLRLFAADSCLDDATVGRGCCSAPASELTPWFMGIIKGCAPANPVGLNVSLSCVSGTGHDVAQLNGWGCRRATAYLVVEEDT